jgi:hypothetical protein
MLHKIRRAVLFCRRLLTTEARVRAQVTSRRICGGQNGTGTGSSPSPSVFPCQYHSTAAPYSLMYHLGAEQWTQHRRSSTETQSHPVAATYIQDDRKFTQTILKYLLMVAIQYNSIGLKNTQYRCDYTRAHAGHVML